MAAEADFARRFSRALRGVRNDHARLRIVQLFRVLWHFAADAEQPPTVIVVTARRMACLFALATRCGLTLGDRVVVVVSDRFTLLHDPPDAWGRWRVVLIDDVVDRGDTLSRRTSDLSEVTGGLVHTSALFITEADPAALPNELAELGTPLSISKESSRDLAVDLSTVFGQQLLPLITDFPITVESHVEAGEVEEMLASTSWASFEVTNSFVAGHSVRAYTLLPFFDVSSLTGVPAELIDLCKLRLFVRSAVDGDTLRVVPLMTLRPVESESIQTYYRELGYDRLSKHSNGVALALSNYVISKHLWDEVQGRQELRLNIPDSAIDAQLADLYLGPTLVQRVDAEFRPDVLDGLRSVRVAAQDLKLDLDRLSTFRSLETIESHCIVGDNLVAEVARSISRDMPRTTSDLTHAFDVSVQVLGLGLDVLNDMGWAVPSSLTRDGVDQRCFAGGEISDQDPEPGVFGGRWAAVPETLIQTYSGATADGLENFLP